MLPPIAHEWKEKHRHLRSSIHIVLEMVILAKVQRRWATQAMPYTAKQPDLSLDNGADDAYHSARGWQLFVLRAISLGRRSPVVLASAVLC
jgi:hypothetical protein